MKIINKGVNKLKSQDWHELTKLTQGLPLIVERVSIPERGIAIEGSFELPVLARLSEDDQVFVMAFIKAEGVIKEMERIFGVSYPTIKNRLSHLAEQLQFVETIPVSQQQDTVDSLERGEITADEAIRRLSK
jgi:hypothetical protein